MKNYKEKTVFMPLESFSDWVYLSEGQMRNHHARSWKERYKSKVVYQDEAELTFGKKIWRVQKEDGDFTSWFTSQEMAEEFIDINKALHLFTAKLNTDEVSPLPETFKVYMEKAKDGRFFSRVNLHPEINGDNSSFGKVCFPDKSWTTPLWEGAAMVSIVRELENYAFLKGEMVKPQNIEDLSDLSEFFLHTKEKWDFYRHKILKINSPLRGDYIAIDLGAGKLKEIKPSKEAAHQYDCLQTNYVLEDTLRAGCVESMSLMDFVLKYTYGIDSVPNLLDMFHQSELFCKHLNLRSQGVKDEDLFLDLIQESINDKESVIDIEDAFLDAFDSGFLTPYVLCDKIPVILVSDCDTRLLSLPWSYMKVLGELTKKINSEADDAIRKETRAGKIRIN